MMRRFVFLTMVALVMAVVLASPAWAATYTVDRIDDPDLGTTPTAGDCTDAANDCSLRGAITAANANAGDDTIDIGVTGTVNLTGVLPDLSSTIDLKGPGADQFTVRRDSGGDYRIFTVTSGSVVSISGITISNGSGTGSFPNNFGGGIYNARGGILTISGSTISQNRSDARGGGIYNDDGIMTISGSTISRNSSQLGGGIYTTSILNGTMTISGSTISQNTVTQSGAGVFSASDLSITNSTISGNNADVSGGGVYNGDDLTALKHSTVVGNAARSDRVGGVASDGDDRAFARTEVLSSIVSANQGTDVGLEGGGTANSFVSEGYNLIGDGDATAAFDKTGDQIIGNDDPRLGPLADNGGPTQTRALLAGSPAIDAGPPTDGDPIACPPPLTDQRGVSRPQESACDIGSFELQSQALSINDITVTEGDSGTTNATFTVSLSKASAQAVTVSYATADGTATAGTDYQSSSGTLTFAAGQTTQSVSVQVNGEIVSEDDETFFVNLSNSTNAEISDAEGIGTINNDDNTAPTAEGDSYTTNEDTTLTANGAGSNPAGVLANDTDPDGDSLNAVLVSGPSHAATNGFTLNQDGSFSYIPAANFFGTDTFTYKANDGTADSNVVTVSLTVNSVNDAPTVAVAAGGSCGTNLRSGTINLTVNDPDGPAGSLLLSATSNNTTLVPASNVTFGGSGASRTLTATAVSGKTGTATITVTVSDDTATGTVALTLKAGGNSNDTLTGASATDNITDILLGQNGNDTLRGLGGKDLLCGARGNDRLSGGADADRFEGGSGTDTATDFSAGQGDTRVGIP